MYNEARKALRESLELEGHSHAYVTAVAGAARSTRLKAAVTGTRAPERIKRSELKGQVTAYTDMAETVLRWDMGTAAIAAPATVRKHIKEWLAAMDEDEAEQRKAF